MDKKRKALNLLGLAMRAGKLAHGEDDVLIAIRNQTAKYVFVASNASENTLKKLTDKTTYFHVPISTDFTSQEISQAIGKQRTNVAVCDQGFSSSLEKLLQG